MSSQDLQLAFDFTPDELAQNKAGKLSAKQQKDLEKTRQMRGCGRRAAVYGLGGTTGLFTLFYIYLLLTGRLGSIGAVIAVGVVLLVFIGAFLAAFALDYTRGQDLKTGRITVVEGVASGHQAKKRRGAPEMGDIMEYYVKVGERRIRVVSLEQMEALQGGERYRLYLIKNPPVDIVLSVEEM